MVVKIPKLSDTRRVALTASINQIISSVSSGHKLKNQDPEVSESDQNFEKYNTLINMVLNDESQDQSIS